MGLLKKIFKPVSKVLDKIIPNEIKPALPYLAAFAPYMAPGIMGIGGNTMLSRALMSGGLNIGAQLAQEGSEGDINLLSAGLGALQGAMTTPQGANYAFSAPAEGPVITQGAEGILKAKAAGMEPGMMKSGLEALGKGSKFLTGAAETLQSNPFSVEGLKAAAIPFAQGTADVMYAEGQRNLKDLAKDVVDDMGGGYTDDAYRAAIRKSMTAYGATEEEIIDAIEAAGYKSGGRVGLKGGGADFGGIPAAIQNIKEDEEETITIMTDNGPMEIKKSVYESMPGMFMDTTTSAYGDAGRGRPVPQFANGGRIGFRDGSSTGSFGLDRYASEMISEGNMLNKDAIDFLDKYEDIVKEGKADERLFDLLKEYKTLEDRADKSLDKFSNTKLEDEAEGIMSVEDMKYYDKKMEDIDKKLDDSDKRLNTLDEEFVTKGIDASEITRTPDFQEWLELYMSERRSSRSKALNHPNADIYLGLLGARLKGRDENFYEAVPRKKDGGLMNLGGREMDMRGGGFIPIGKKERADDVPARLSKNEFVMTADAVRAAGGGSVNQGAKRMYNLMHNLEARA